MSCLLSCSRDSMLLRMLDEQVLQVLQALEALQIRYMLTGSFASNIYGEPRSTMDADFVIALQAKQMEDLTTSLGQEFYFDSETLEEAKESGGHFNAVYKSSGMKADFYLLAEGEYPRIALGRRRREKFLDQDIWVISPEDLILAKLQWAKKGESSRQIEDAEGICRTQKDRLEFAYLDAWARKLAVVDSLAKIL